MGSKLGTEEAARHGIARSSKWPHVEKEHLAKHPECIVCGDIESVQVHHQFPFHYAIALGRPDLELDDRNLVTLCETSKSHGEQNHHLLIGHLDDFKSSNINVREDSILFKNMTSSQVIINETWLAKKANKLKPLDKMTDEDKKEFRELMDKTFPLESK